MKCDDDDDDDALSYFSFILYFCCYVKFVSLFSPSLAETKKTYISLSLPQILGPKLHIVVAGRS
jgi:hypothetical protein